ncbi:MAG: glutamate-1-semialdehyde 2,1-aminomutase [Thermoplasmata archaeon]
MAGSEKLFEEALQIMPGGVSSPVRAFSPYPRFIRRGRGSRIEDVEGREYVDLCLGFGPLIVGHAHPAVVERLERRMEEGFLFGAPVEEEVLLAKRIVESVPSIDMVRFVNTGTEATMHCLRLARGYTGRKKIVAMEGGFHGAHDGLLVKAGSGAAKLSLPKSKGVLDEAVAHTLLVPYNDGDALREALKQHREDVAAIIVEPILGNIGVVPPREGYLQEVREMAQEQDVLLIFDEVITGFRLGPAGAQGYYDVHSDLTTLGKVVGGGLPCAAIGGRRDIMERFSPSGEVYQAGTFSGNPLSMTAGLATLKVLEEKGYKGLHSMGGRVRRGLQSILEGLGLPFEVQCVESMFQIFFTGGLVSGYTDALRCDKRAFTLFFRRMLDAGFYLPPSQFETNFLSTAHTDKEIDAFLEAAEGALREGQGR